jgi:hypothetical protein
VVHVNAQLKPVPMPVRKPVYNNSPKHFGLWLYANHDLLSHYYAELGRALPKDAVDGLQGASRSQNFMNFAKCQFDVAKGNPL